mmetsp:Transcript_15275/g.47690  ORF Transcript_15275/g.47690 Transcript_15275/m.47690 type:complete len:225 (+) Transcript_15275:436-1110(+)
MRVGATSSSSSSRSASNKLPILGELYVLILHCVVMLPRFKMVTRAPRRWYANTVSTAPSDAADESDPAAPPALWKPALPKTREHSQKVSKSMHSVTGGLISLYSPNWSAGSSTLACTELGRSRLMRTPTFVHSRMSLPSRSLPPLPNRLAIPTPRPSPELLDETYCSVARQASSGVTDGSLAIISTFSSCELGEASGLCGTAVGVPVTVAPDVGAADMPITLRK